MMRKQYWLLALVLTLCYGTTIIGGLFSLIGCSMKSMPEGELVRLRLVNSGTMAHGLILMDRMPVQVAMAWAE